MKQYLENFLKYRWENIKNLSFQPVGEILKYPGIYEGFGYYQMLISYSAQAHMREARWLKNPALAQGSILNFIANQNEDGSFPGHLTKDRVFEKSFYHADWGSSVLEVHKIHPDSLFLEAVYPGLVRYAAYFENCRDPEHCFLYDVWNHYETGQEFSPRYTAVYPKADQADWGKVFRLKGVDATVYIYNLWGALSKIAEILGKIEDAQSFELKKRKTKKAILSFMWDKELEMFFDVDPKTMIKTGVKALTCFYPYMTDIISKKHLPGLKLHLFSEKEFWTKYPFPTLSIDHPDFSSDGIWRGEKKGCPWNGRVWPMTNSHMAEAIAKCAIRFGDQELKRLFVEFFNRWLRMMFFDGNPNHPNSFEHYHPFTGEPSTQENGFLGVNNYLHSWINDLIIKYVAGLRHPFPFDIKYVIYKGAL